MDLSCHFIDESLVINKTYYETLKSQLTCIICSGLLNNPLICSNCEIAYCQKCINTWIENNETCPMRCPLNKCTIKEISRLMKNLMENTQLKCKFGCEVSLLSYPEHIIKCETNHKDDITCKYCGRNSQYLGLKNQNSNLLKQNIDMKIQILETNLKYEEEILRSKLELKLKKVEEFNRVKKELDDLIIEYNFTQLKTLEVVKSIKLKIEDLKQERSLLPNSDEIYYEEDIYLSRRTNSLFRSNILNSVPDMKEKKLKTSFVKTDNPNIDFLNNNRTIKLKQYGWIGIMCDEKVGSNGAFEIDFRIDNTNYFGYIILGFAVAGTDSSNGFYTTNKCWMFDLRDGYLFNNDGSDCNCYLITGCKPKNGDIISLCIDMDLDEIYIKFNGILYSYRKKMRNFDSAKKENLYPCVDFYSQNDQISLM